jgi:hypothetical protein
MRTLYLLVVINVALILSSCAVTHTPPPTPINPQHVRHWKHCHHHKDPVNVSFLKVTPPDCPYRVLGEARVSRFNDVGIKRQEATIRDLMREQAASLDGDAVINIRKEDRIITATVIAYKKVLA